MKTLLRYPGSKWNLANKIVDLLPKHKSYLEPYFGSGAVLFTKLPSAIETVNDLNEDVVNLFEIVRDNPIGLKKALSLESQVAFRHVVMKINRGNVSM